MSWLIRTELGKRKKAMEEIKKSYDREIKVLDNLERDAMQRKEFARFERFFSWSSFTSFTSFTSLRSTLDKMVWIVEKDGEIVENKLYGKKEMHLAREAMLWREIQRDLGKIAANLNSVPAAQRDNWPYIVKMIPFNEIRKRIAGYLLQIQKELVHVIKYEAENIDIDRKAARKIIEDFRGAMQLTAISRK